jgi:hypothetical protein
MAEKRKTGVSTTGEPINVDEKEDTEEQGVKSGRQHSGRALDVGLDHCVSETTLTAIAIHERPSSCTVFVPPPMLLGGSSCDISVLTHQRWASVHGLWQHLCRPRNHSSVTVPRRDGVNGSHSWSSVPLVRSICTEVEQILRPHARLGHRVCLDLHLRFEPGHHLQYYPQSCLVEQPRLRLEKMARYAAYVGSNGLPLRC